MPWRRMRSAHRRYSSVCSAWRTNWTRSSISTMPARRQIFGASYIGCRKPVCLECSARSMRNMDLLTELVVVTYTNRAADEMQQRTRQQILEAHLSLDVVEAFNRAFFGTIHSFCMKLLAAHGHHLGLPANLELITDDDDVWNQFVEQYTTVGRPLSEGNRRVLLRFLQARTL